MLRPTQDYILVKPLERVASSVIQVINWEKHCRGQIVAVGPGKRNSKGKIQPMDSEVGQIIAFGNGNFDFYPKFYDTDGTLYRLIQEADICFVDEGVCDVSVPEITHDDSRQVA